MDFEARQRNYRRAALVRQWMRTEGLTTAEAAEVLGVSPQSVSNYRTGQTGISDRVLEQVRQLMTGARPLKVFERGIPPVRTGQIYRFEGMAVGDSFPIAAEKEKSARAALWQWKQRSRSPAKFTIRRDANKMTGEVGYRCWRLE